MSPVPKYESIIASGLIRRDPQQVRVLERLQRLNDTMRPRGGWRSLLGGKEEKQGMYLYGGVGSGKTMLMDLFYDACVEPLKRRVHYNAFMLNVHAKLHALRMRTKDPVDVLGRDIAKEVRLLCLDEFQVVDVADAMLLRNLLETLLAHNVKFVMTSNRHPGELYLNGIQRASFLPCIDLLERRLEVVELKGQMDYRRKDAVDEIRIFQWPINDATQRRLEIIFNRLCRSQPAGSRTIYTHGRPIEVRRCAEDVAMFTFDELCSRPLSGADYLCIAANFPKIVLSGVPVMTFSHRDEARRFITMMDIFYDNRVKLVMQSAVPPAELFQLGRRPTDRSGDERLLTDELAMSDKTMAESSLTNGMEEVFATHRTVSRLAEMQHLGWWAADDRRFFSK